MNIETKSKLGSDSARQKNFITSRDGFTLIELLVVTSIIGLLAAVVLISLNNARVKGRDARRAADMRQIYNAINLFYDKYGCLPITSGSSCAGAGGYSDANAGGWDYSSQGGFMGFLVTSGFMSKVGVDPTNNMTGDTTPVGTYAYRYYCYPSGSYPGVHLGYWRESDGQYMVAVNGKLVTAQQANAGDGNDASFICQ